jgi:hypothetical protein
VPALLAFLELPFVSLGSAEAAQNFMMLDWLIRRIESLLRQNRSFLQPFQPDHPCPALNSKIFLFHFSEIHVSLPASCFRQRGGSRSSRTLEAGCGGREGVQRAEARRRKQLHGRQKRVVLISRCWDQALLRRCAGRRWLQSPEHRGEHAISRNTIARGMPVADSNGRRNTKEFGGCDED